MRPIIFLVIESGAVYSLTLLVLLILYKAQSWFQYVLLDAVRRTSLNSGLVLNPIDLTGFANRREYIPICHRESNFIGMHLGSCILYDHYPNWFGHYNACRRDRRLVLQVQGLAITLVRHGHTDGFRWATDRAWPIQSGSP